MFGFYTLIPREAKNEIAKRFASIKDAAKKRGERVKHGTLVRLINEVKEKTGVSAKILPSAIRRRLDRQSLHSHHLAGGQVSPLVNIEPTILGIIIQINYLITKMKWSYEDNYSFLNLSHHPAGSTISVLNEVIQSLFHLSSSLMSV